jgi:hypothetical protein
MKRNLHRNKLEKVTSTGQDEFLSQFSIIPIINKGPLESARIRVIPTGGENRENS